MVEDSYDGPTLATDEAGNALVTPEFLEALLERFKAQKLLHSKYTLMLLLAALKQFQPLPNIVAIKTADVQPVCVLRCCGCVRVNIPT